HFSNILPFGGRACLCERAVCTSTGLNSRRVEDNTPYRWFRPCRPEDRHALPRAAKSSRNWKILPVLPGHFSLGILSPAQGTDHAPRATTTLNRKLFLLGPCEERGEG